MKRKRTISLTFFTKSGAPPRERPHTQLRSIQGCSQSPAGFSPRHPANRRAEAQRFPSAQTNTKQTKPAARSSPHHPGLVPKSQKQAFTWCSRRLRLPQRSPRDRRAGPEEQSSDGSWGSGRWAWGCPGNPATQERGSACSPSAQPRAGQSRGRWTGCRVPGRLHPHRPHPPHRSGQGAPCSPSSGSGAAASPHGPSPRSRRRTCSGGSRPWGSAAR